MIPISNPLRDARLQSDRAKVHLSSLKGSITKFKKKATTFEIIPEINEQGRQLHQWPPTAPDSWGPIASDFASALRKALNYVVWGLSAKQMRDMGAGREPNKRTQFPICDTTKKYRETGRAQIPDILPAALPEIERVQPYNRTKWPEVHLLSVLRELANQTNHRFIIQPDSIAQIIVPPKGKIGIRFNKRLNKVEIITNLPAHMRDPQANGEPYLTIKVSLEIPTISPSIYDITILDDIYQFVCKEVIPRFTSFF